MSNRERLGRIAYEAMIKCLNRRRPQHAPSREHSWESQDQEVRDDWMDVAEAVRASVVE